VTEAAIYAHGRSAAKRLGYQPLPEPLVVPFIGPNRETSQVVTTGPDAAPAHPLEKSPAPCCLRPRLLIPPYSSAGPGGVQPGVSRCNGKWAMI